MSFPNFLLTTAVAYQLGLSIKNHVYPHAGKPYLLKMDIAAFFPSISVFSVANLLKRHGYDHSIAMTMAHLLTLRGSVPQGAPSSPSLSNAIFLLADTAIKEYCQKRNLTYTRYADDLAISGSEIDDKDILFFIEILKREGFQSNESKRRLFRPGSNGRLLTGLVINGNDIRVPKATRRKIRHSIHVLEKYLFSDLGLEEVVGCGIANGDVSFDPLSMDRTLGQLRFWQWIEPDCKFASDAANRLKRLQSKIIDLVI